MKTSKVTQVKDVVVATSNNKIQCNAFTKTKSSLSSITVVTEYLYKNINYV